MPAIAFRQEWFHLLAAAALTWQAGWLRLDWRRNRHWSLFAGRPSSGRDNPLMFEWDVHDRHFYIRDVEGEAEHHAIEDIQKEAWGFNDLDIVPAATLIATQHAGGIVLGAFEGSRMIG